MLIELNAETYKEYVRRLTEELGLKKLGNGAFGTVIQHPTLKNVVAKVVRADSKYLKFCEFAKANRNNPWLPKIADIAKLNLDDAPSAYLVFLEKLRPLLIDRWQKFRKDLGSIIGVDPDVNKARRWFSEYEWLALELRLKLKRQDPNLLLVVEYLLKNYAYLDLHLDNLMLRGNQLVFVDPVSDQSEYKGH